MSGSGLFERLALAQISGHLSPRETICDLDRITALGFAPALGSLLIRVKGGNDAASYRDALELIAERLYNIGKRKGWGHKDRMRRVAAEALRFYVFDMCAGCKGRGNLAHSYSGPQEDEAGQVCGDCGGSGKASRNVQARATSILVKGEIPRRLADMLDAADGLVERAARISTGISRWKLYGRD